jgi:hypothetical protein
MRFCIVAMLLLSLVLQSQGAHTTNVSGVAVSIQTADSTGYAGKLMKYVITNGAVSSSVMLLKDSVITNVVMSTDGKKVAFFKANKFWGPDSVNIMMLDINGGTPVNISKDICPHNMDYSVDMDWPTGDWVYYLKGIDQGDCSKELWKVNINTREKIRAWTTTNARLWLVSLTNDATKAIIRTNEWFQVPNGGPANIFYFPRPADGTNITLNITDYKYGEGCGTAVSCDGAWLLEMGTLNHDHVSIQDWVNNHTVFDLPLATLANWNGFFGKGTGGNNTFSVNSPKWVCLSVGWLGRDGGGGSNQVLVNWQDSVIIKTTNSLQVDSNKAKTHQYNDVGDFWVGNPGVTSAMAVPAPLATGVMTNGPVALFNMLGRKISSVASKNIEWDGSALRGIKLSRGVYFVQYRTGDKVQTQKLLVP